MVDAHLLTYSSFCRVASAARRYFSTYAKNYRTSPCDWPFEPDGPKVRVKRKGLPHERLVTFMAHRNPGRTYMNLISREFGPKPQERKDLQKVLRDENHATTLALKAVGVTYGSEGKGRGAKSFLVKTA